jgi:hypothetical protein
MSIKTAPKRNAPIDTFSGTVDSFLERPNHHNVKAAVFFLLVSE